MGTVVAVFCRVVGHRKIIDLRHGADAAVEPDGFVGIHVPKPGVGFGHLARRHIGHFAEPEVDQLFRRRGNSRRQLAALFVQLFAQIRVDIVERLVVHGERGTVERRGQAGDRIDPVGFAAFEKVGQTAVGRGGLFFLVAIGENRRKQRAGRAAEAVADQVDLVGAVPLTQQAAAGVVLAVARMAEPFAVGFAVIDPGAGELGIQFACAVPRGADRVDRRGIGDKAGAVDLFHKIARKHAPIGQLVGALVILAPAEKAVDKNERIVCFVGCVIHRGAGAFFAKQTGQPCSRAHRVLQPVHDGSQIISLHRKRLISNR